MDGKNLGGGVSTPNGIGHEIVYYFVDPSLMYPTSSLGLRRTYGLHADIQRVVL